MKCYFVCENSSHTPIPLPNRQPVVIGRTPLTQIKDERCSRRQLELCADYVSQKVNITQLGSNTSSIDGKDMIKGVKFSVKEQNKVFVLSGLYPHFVKFTISDKTKSDSNIASSKIRPDSSSKRKIENNEMSNRNDRKKLKIDDTSDSKTVLSSGNESASHTVKSTVTQPHEIQPYQTTEGKNCEVEIIKRKLEAMKKTKDDCVPEESPSGSSNGNKDSLSDVLSANSIVDNSKLTNKTTLPRKLSNASDYTQCNKNTWIKYSEKLTIGMMTGLISRNKIAGFDIDGTLICTKSGRVFPKDHNDWQLWHSSIPQKLDKLHQSGFKIVLFTNQLGVAKGKTDINTLKSKFEKLVNTLQVPAQILISTAAGYYRKPCYGMWIYLQEEGNEGLAINLADSFYVGDAAGRKDKWAIGKKKDFSCSDRLFALNIGLKFYTPEEYFLKSPAVSYNLPVFDPRNTKLNVTLLNPPTATPHSSSIEVIVVVGYPAAGKSTFVKEHILPHGYVHINRDMLGSWQKCVARCVKSIKDGQSAVIDNTNPEVESRKRYISAAKEGNVPCRCFVLTTSFAQAKHNERFREITDRSHAPINDMVMNSYKAKFTEPSLLEGFTEIVQVNVIPSFKDSETRKIYRQFLMEK